MRTVSTIRKLILTIPGAVLAYLLQVCLIEQFKLGSSIAGNIVWAFLSVMIVSCGRKSAFCAAAVVGLLMESMLNTVPGLNVISYPLLTLLWSLVFADMSEEQRSRRLMSRKGREAQDLPAFLRIFIGAGCLDASFHTINLAYIYLAGTPLTIGHILRALASIVYTMALTAVIGWPLRKFLGMYRREKIEQTGGAAV